MVADPVLTGDALEIDCAPQAFYQSFCLETPHIESGNERMKAKVENQLLVFGQDARVAWENSMHDSMELPFGGNPEPI